MRRPFQLFKKRNNGSLRFFQTTSKTEHKEFQTFFQITWKTRHGITEILSNYFKNKTLVVPKLLKKTQGIREILSNCFKNKIQGHFKPKIGIGIHYQVSFKLFQKQKWTPRFFHSWLKCSPRNFQITSKTRQEIPEILSDYFKNKTQQTPESISNYFEK